MTGRRAAFERIVVVHADAAYNLAAWLLQSRADAEDLVQEALLRAFRSFDGFSGENAKPWFLAIVRNLAYTALSARRRGANVISLDDAIAGRNDVANLPALASPDTDPETAAIERLEAARIREAIAALPPPFRETVVLREMEELSYAEIAAVTGVPAGTVMSRLARARAQLKANLVGSNGTNGQHAL